MNTITSKWLRICAACAGILALTVGVFLTTAQTAWAVNGPTVEAEGICMQAVYGTPVTNANRLNCAASDIKVAKATSVSPNTCIQGSTIPILTATFEVDVTSNSRYDAGFFFRTDGLGSARGDNSNATGKCSLSGLYPDVAPAMELDGDNCGDFNSGLYQVTFKIGNVVCQGVDHDKDPATPMVLRLPNCTSWHSNSSTLCKMSDPFQASDAMFFAPETKSKCRCDDNFTVPVTVEQAQVQVEKSTTTNFVQSPGAMVLYSVKVSNGSSLEDMTIDSLGDSVGIYTYDLGSGGTVSSEPAGGPDVTDNTCNSLIDKVVLKNSFVTCSFKGPVYGDANTTVTDIVEACASTGGGQACDDDPASVGIKPASVAPSLAKTVTSWTMDVTYTVTVSNNSSEYTLTVNSLMDDKYGDIGTGGSDAPQCLDGSSTSLIGDLISKSGSVSCTFIGTITNTSPHANEVTVGVTDSWGNLLNAKGNATVTVTTSP